MKKGKERAPQRIATGGGAPLRQGLPGLDALRDRLPEAPPAASTPAPTPADARDAGAPAGDAAARAGTSSVFARSPRLVVRRERKGHGGKSATRIEGIVGSTIEIEQALRDIKRALGCGAVRDGNAVVVQGAPGDRLVAFLAARGARKVVVGS